MAQDATGELFKVKCGICHTIGGGRLVGPDLTGVNDKYDQKWTVDFIRSSQKMINSGDAKAVAIYKEYNEVAMPDPMISDAQIISILSYINEKSGGTALATVPESTFLKDATDEHHLSGQKLFDGRKGFANGGPACSSCHNELSSFAFQDNSFSTKDIRESFGNLGEQGTRAIMENPPFPVMKKAFEGHELEESEVHDLLVFLRDADVKEAGSSPLVGYFLYGLLGALLLLAVFAFLWNKRRSGCVNEDIYFRQYSSTN